METLIAHDRPYLRTLEEERFPLPYQRVKKILFSEKNTHAEMTVSYHFFAFLLSKKKTKKQK